ncbi:CRAL/TRIO domain containing protein [Nitzschia inconspicua]|uniref:CRAL/TRIO domain containing protein n=1 Tax=Nitzschia inconspicua TaxID=303405 RepID=A0A9K3LNF8_9STRA|nr:CRAL/TRIO domain containing protein [Nitzschia inconspicua]
MSAESAAPPPPTEEELHPLAVSTDHKDWIPIFQECLASTAAAVTGDIGDNIIFRSEEERETCRKLVEELGDDDLKVQAANTSYAFWYLSTQLTGKELDGDILVTDNDMVYAAMREARRHYVNMNNDYDKALRSLTELCQNRKKNKIDLLRTCFDPNYEYGDPQDGAKAKEMAILVRSDMERQFHILRGQDKYGQAIMIKYPRTKGGTTESSYVMAQIYIAERSTAATEFLTRGKRERSIAVYNYLGFDRSMSPGFPMQVAAATQLQQMYPERLQTLVFVEPPFWLKGILGLLSPFLSESITARIQWASGAEERESTFANILGPGREEHAIPLLQKSGKLTSAVSLDHFFVDSPFFGTYDSFTCQRKHTDDELEVHRIACTGCENEGSSRAKSSLSDGALSFWGSLSSSYLR